MISVFLLQWRSVSSQVLCCTGDIIDDAQSPLFVFPVADQCIREEVVPLWPLALKQVHEMVNSELGETLDYQKFLHALRASAKNGVPRFIIDGEVVGLVQSNLGFTAAVQEQLSKRTKALLCSCGGAMQLDDIEKHLRANGCVWSREQLITSLQSSAKNGVPRYVFDGELVQLAKRLSWRREQKEASK